MCLSDTFHPLALCHAPCNAYGERTRKGHANPQTFSLTGRALVIPYEIVSFSPVKQYVISSSGGAFLVRLFFPNRGRAGGITSEPHRPAPSFGGKTRRRFWDSRGSVCCPIPPDFISGISGGF